MADFRTMQDVTIEFITDLKIENKKFRQALEYISDHAWAAEKPKWGNEFVDVANEALGRSRDVFDGTAQA